MKLVERSSSATHALPDCVDACRCYGGLPVWTLQERSRDESLAPRFLLVPGIWAFRSPPRTTEWQRGRPPEREPPAIRAASDAAGCLGAALWAFDRSSTFVEGALRT